MNTTVPHNLEACQQRAQRLLSVRLRRGLALIGAVGVGLLMTSLVFALSNYQTFHAVAEQINLGISVSASYADTLATDGTYRLVKEEYMSGEVRTSGDVTSTYYIFETYTNVVNFTPYTMPPEGGFISRIAIYIFQSGNAQVRLALYDDVDNEPHVLLTETEPLSATTTGWLWFDIEPVLVPGGTRYWLAYQATNNEVLLGWKPATEEYRFREWPWDDFPQPAGTTWGGAYSKSCYQIQYIATQYALDVGYVIPVTPTMDAYTLTVRGATSGEPFSVTADGQAVGVIPYTPTMQHFFSDDMESGVSGWTADGFMRIVTDSDHYNSPTHVWWTDDVPYGSSASLTSVPITLPFNAHDMELRFWHRMVSEGDWDGGWVEYRTQNENGIWPMWSELTRTMFIRGEYNGLLAHVPSGTHWGWSGRIVNVVRVQIPVTAAGRPIQWRWVFECDTIGGEPPDEPDGWWIDDVRVLGATSDDAALVFSLPLSLANDGQVTVRFQDTITDSYPDLLGIDLIEIAGFLDNRPPTVTVTTPNGGEYLSGTQTLKWNGSDTNRDVITYNIYLSTDGGDTWSSSLYEVSYTETETPATHSWGGFNTTAFGDSTKCLIRIQASDGDASASDQSDAAFAIDNTPPNGTVTIAEGNYAISRDVHLLLDAPDDATEMYIDGDLIDASNVRQWIAYTTTATVTLIAGEGSKTITVRFRDMAGNEGDLASDTIIYDMTPPTMANETPADGSTVTTATPIISATLTDATSGIDSTAITMTLDGSPAAYAYDEGSGTVSYTPSPALTNASHVVTLSAQDRAGNVAPWTWSFSVNEPPASVLLTADPTSIVANGVSTATITATVRSNSGHPVTDGTEVVFSTTMGTLVGGAVYTTTTQGGVAVAVLTAPETDGTAVIPARASEAVGMIEVLLIRFRVYLPIVVSAY